MEGSWERAKPGNQSHPLLGRKGRLGEPAEAGGEEGQRRVCTPGGWGWLPDTVAAREDAEGGWGDAVRGPGLSGLGIWPFGGHWAGAPGRAGQGPLPERGVKPAPSGGRKGPRRAPGKRPRSGRAPHRGCAARGRTPASGGSGGGGSLAPWSPWMRMRGTRGLWRAGGGALGPRYR